MRQHAQCTAGSSSAKGTCRPCVRSRQWGATRIRLARRSRVGL